MSNPGTGRFADFVRRYFGTKNGETVNVLPDVMPVVAINEEAPELRAYRGERRWECYYTQAAGGAATYARLLFGLPATANRMVVVERYWVSKAGSGVVVAGVSSPGAALTTQTTTAVPLDARAFPDVTAISNATDVWYTGSTPAAIVASAQRIDAVNVGGGQPAWSVGFPGLVLEPGGPGLIVQDATANEAIEVWLLCYDVPLHGSEEM